MEMFQGSQGTIRLRVRLSCICASLCVRVMLIQTGPRAIPDTGPDLVGRRTADFAADLALPSPAVSHHKLVL